MAAEFTTSHDRIAHAKSVPNVARVERRSRVRTNVHWKVTIFREHSSGAVEAVTENLSSDGFYCLTAARFAAGEGLVTLLHVPAHDPRDRKLTHVFRCEARVVRVEATHVDGWFGAAFHIVDYCVWGGDAGEPCIVPVELGDCETDLT